MKIVRNPEKLRKILSTYSRRGKSIGFVPTMGALHAGHLSLVRASVAENDITVVSIFVNPLQFAPGEDLSRYPRPIGPDTSLCRKAGADLLFLPTNETLYGPNQLTWVEVRELSSILCGISRPTHFRGVTTVVVKLLNIVSPATLYLGQKDYQQAFIVGKMIRDLNMPVKLKVCPTVREKDGLAMSSRNAYLSPEQRDRALCLYKSLELAKKLAANGERHSRTIIKKMTSLIAAMTDPASDKIDYIAVSDTAALKPLEKIPGKAVVSLAVRIGATRLIDNAIVRISRSA